MSTGAGDGDARAPGLIGPASAATPSGPLFWTSEELIPGKKRESFFLSGLVALVTNEENILTG